MDFAKTTPSEDTWIDKMKGYLKWKVRGPDIHNPYAPKLTSVQLTRLVNDQKYLRENIELRCTCDGYEVMLIKNLEQPRIRRDHPCLNVLTKRQVIDAIERHGLEELISLELEKIQKDLAEELVRRQNEKKSDAISTSGKTIKEIRQEKEEQRRAQAQASVQDNSDDKPVEKKKFRSLLK